MKRNCLMIVVLVLNALSFGTVSIQAQTIAYKLVKTVSKDGEVYEVRNNDPSYGNYKTYIHFTNNKSSFYIAKYDGSRAGFPDASSGYGCGFGNQDVSGNFSGISTAVRDPINFTYNKTQNGIKIYTASRPLLARNFTNGSVYVSGKATDYAKFNADFSRLNVVQDASKGMYGLYPFKNIAEEGMTLVFEIYKAPNSSGSVFY